MLNDDVKHEFKTHTHTHEHNKYRNSVSHLHVNHLLNGNKTVVQKMSKQKLAAVENRWLLN